MSGRLGLGDPLDAAFSAFPCCWMINEVPMKDESTVNVNICLSVFSVAQCRISPNVLSPPYIRPPSVPRG